VSEIVYNPFDPAEIVDPYPTYRRLRAEAPVLPVPVFSGYVISSWEQVHRILGDRRYSADRERSTFLAALRAGGTPHPGDSAFQGQSLLTLDPPDHTRLRRLVNSAFTPRRVADLRPRIEMVVEDLLDQVPDTDFIQAFAYPLPVIVIAELLGLPAGDRADLKRWSDDVAMLLEPFPDPGAVASFERSIAEFDSYARDQFEQRRRHPREDLITALVQATDGAETLSDGELFSMVVLLIAAGHETTTNLLGNALVALTRYPDQRPLLTVDPANAVEELIRFDPPVQRTSRVVIEPERIGDWEVTPGDLLFLLLAAANHDPTKFPDPGRLDLARPNAREHLGFGHGLHYCLGAPLARLEAQVALPRLLERYPRIEVELEAIKWRTSIVLRGPQFLPVRV
jgi:cytochrome P450